MPSASVKGHVGADPVVIAGSTVRKVGFFVNILALIFD